MCCMETMWRLGIAWIWSKPKVPYAVLGDTMCSLLQGIHLNRTEIVSGYVCNHGSPSGERDTASPRGRYGERPQRDSVWRYICKNTTCWPATAHDVTTGVPQYKCPPGEYIISFFVWSLRPKHGPKSRGRSVSFPTRGTMVTYVTWDVPLHGNSNCVP